MKSVTDGLNEELDEATIAFERRARQLLGDSVEHLPAATRSRLTRARYAALASRSSWQRSLARRWMPAGAGALAATVLVVLFTVVPHGENPALNSLANASPEDLEMLADSDGVQLGRDQDLDYDFYEWAVSEARDSPSVGT
jgi:uncharacterized protein DUF3619